MEIYIDREQLDRASAALNEIAKTLAEALAALSVPLSELAEAIRAMMPCDTAEALEALAEAADIPEKKRLPRPPKKLGPVRRAVYCRKIRPTARSRC